MKVTAGRKMKSSLKSARRKAGSSFGAATRVSELESCLRFSISMVPGCTCKSWVRVVKQKTTLLLSLLSLPRLGFVAGGRSFAPVLLAAVDSLQLCRCVLPNGLRPADL